MKFDVRLSATRLLAAMLMTSLLLVTSSHAWQPLYRAARRRRPEVPVPLRLRTTPHDVILHPGLSSASVRCRVRVASWALNSFHVGFYVSLHSVHDYILYKVLPGPQESIARR